MKKSSKPYILNYSTHDLVANELVVILN